MATTTSRKSGRSTSKNNNPSGKNQHSGGFVEMARDNPFKAAATAAAAVGAGVFLWSRRNQISDQLTTLSDQIQDWKDDRLAETGDYSTDHSSDDGEGFIARASGRGRKSQSKIAKSALAMKKNGKTTEHPIDPMVEEQTKVGAVAY